MPIQAFPPHFTHELKALSSYTLAKDLGSPTGAGGHYGNVSGMRTQLRQPTGWKESDFRVERTSVLQFPRV